jgi:hypothetical protein
MLRTGTPLSAPSAISQALFARSSTSHDEKRSDSCNNFEALAGALASLAVAGVARVIDSFLPGFQHQFTRRTCLSLRTQFDQKVSQKTKKPEEDYLSGLLRFAAVRSY